MHPLRRLLIAVVLLGVGYFAVPLVLEMFPGEARWQEQVRADALTACTVLKPDAPAELPEGFWERWDAQLAPYDAARREDLNRRLHAYLDFLEAEYGEAADIYTSGVDPAERSDGVRSARARLEEAFGPAAAAMIEDADEVREDAFRTSPRHGGVDPDAPDFRVVAEELRGWLEIARARADDLTTPADAR